jgi:RNA-directed DNA polymerase
LLSNVLLDDLERELERRKLRFVRYADGCNIYIRSVRAGQRVMAPVTRWLSKRLKLQVNPAKSAVAEAGERKFLGFGFTFETQPRRRIAPESLARLRQRVRAIARRTRGVSLASMAAELARYLSGWRGYFGFCQTPSVLERLDGWIRRRLRCVAWKQWKRWHTRWGELRRRGVPHDLAGQTAASAHGPWRIAKSPALHVAFPNASFTALHSTPLAAP